MISAGATGKLESWDECVPFAFELGVGQKESQELGEQRRTVKGSEKLRCRLLFSAAENRRGGG